MGTAGEVEKRDAFVQIGFVGILMPFDLALAAILLLAPLVRHSIVEGRVHQPVELIDIHGVDAIVQPIVFGLMALHRFLVFTALVSVADVQRVAHPFQHLVVEAKPPEQFGELRFERFLADVFAAAGSRVAFALIGVAGAVIIHVALLLDLANHRAAAGMAGDQAREGEVVLAALGLLGEAAAEHALHPFPQFDRHQRFVLALNELAVPFVPAHIEPVAQDGVNGAYRHLGAALGIEQARCMRFASRFLQGNIAARIPVEQPRHDRRQRRFDRDDLLAVRAGDVLVAERRLGRPDALFGLLGHALAGFLRQVVDIVLRHQHLDAVHELFRGTRLARQHHAFLREVHFHVKFVDRHPVLEVAIEPVGLLDQHHADGRMRLEIGHHIAEGGAAGLLGRLHVHIFLRHREAVRRRVFLEQLQLCRDREAFLLLLLGGDTGIDHRLFAGGIGGCGLRCFSHVV